VLAHKYFVLRAGLALDPPRGLPALRQMRWWLQLLLHDTSKFLPPEWGPYVARFYRPAPNAGTFAAFDRAWLHHQHANPHHWQSWLLRNDNGTMTVLRMPEHYMRELVADWCGANRALTGRWGALAWYQQHADVIRLHPATRDEVETLLAELAAKGYA
jgi:hypothetical protein